MKNLVSAAHATFNGDFFSISTQSICGLRYGEPEAPSHYLPPDADDALLGRTLRLALKSSKRVDLEEFQKIWKSGILERNEKESEAWAMQQYGYKTKRALYKHMMICNVEVADGWMEINPSRSDQKGGYSRRVGDGIENIRLPNSVSDTELGAALREGFKRCTGAVALD